MIAQLLKFLASTDAAAHAAAVAELQTMAAPAPAKKRKGNPEALRKWRESQKAGGKPATAKKAKPAAAVVEKPAKVKKARPAWSVTDHVTKKNVKGQIVQIGPFTAWIPEGDKARKAAVFSAINDVCRTDEVRKLAAAIR